MAQLGQLLGENQLKVVEKVKKTTPKTSVGRELINNLLFRLKRRGNLMVEMDGHYLKSVRLSLSSNARNWIPGANKERELHIWVKPFIKDGKYLMFNYNGVIIRASDVFGVGINRVRI